VGWTFLISPVLGRRLIETPIPSEVSGMCALVW